jgi:hypothetical protein
MTATQMTDSDWVRGDLLGHELPVHGDALRAGGAAFLTRAFRAVGSIGADNSVTGITHFEEWAGGSTGRKVALSVAYERRDPNLPEQLFVKFSRDLNDPIRDRAKVQMESEVRFALLSRIPDFPVPVPRCLFADYQLETGTGVLISERIGFGAGGIERPYPKCRDYEMPDVPGHYESLVSAIARLAGSHRAGRFSEDTMAHFTEDPFKLQMSARQRYSAQQIRNRVARYADFAARFPRLLPEAIRSDTFVARFAEEAAGFADCGDVVSGVLQGDPNMVAFCHWNANVDNAWFWRDDDGRIACGLMDWGNVGQMNMGMALAGCLTFAEPDYLVANLDHLFALFTKVYEESCGGRLDSAAIKDHFALLIASTSPMWLLDVPVLLERHIPDLADVQNRFDPRIQEDEYARTQLHMLTVFLTLWAALDLGALLERTVRQADGAASGPR